ncbi:2OG-Fe(II) oxygenase [Micromonospora sp. CPCC 206061]|uniref:2OG-Fe(II) oxygenase n=1 Tax=Micromonospora sp. CPCC 206061 TaxID=3122410 RepID=UPI002FF06C57
MAAEPDGSPFRLDSVAGRYVVLCLPGPTSAPVAAELLDDRRVTFVTVLPDSRQLTGPATMRRVCDPDGAISQAYGGPATYVLSPNLRVLHRLPPEPTSQSLVDLLEGLPSLDDASIDAPVLIVPDLLEPAFRHELVLHHARTGGQHTGVMRALPDGRTVLVDDPGYKRRRDVLITDEAMRAELRDRITRRLVPEIRKAFQFEATRIERYLLACYDADDGGFFRAHRDNTTPATAHRRFAVSINLNTGEYEGGRLRFPEFSRRLYDVAAGGAIVFSCSLQHEVTPVTQGRRYCCLPFLYDEAAAASRPPTPGG